MTSELQTTSGSESESLQQQAFRKIEREITLCNYPPGTKLTTNTLAASLGLGRTPVREALLRLQDIGLVESVPQVGTFVSKINLDDAEAGRYVREVIGRKVAVECCAKWQGSDLEAMERANEGMYEALVRHDRTSYFEYDNAFHREVYLVAHQERIYTWMKDIVIPLERLRWLRLMTERLDWSLLMAQHEGILAAMKSRNSDEVDFLMAQHVHQLLQETDAIVVRFPSYFSGVRTHDGSEGPVL
jgi:DNA-binding GntR family transcriptional regulator